MVAIPKESWSGKIKEIAFGATDDEGGTRDKKLLLGGETTLPFLAFDGNVSRPAIGMEVIDQVATTTPTSSSTKSATLSRIPSRGRVHALISMAQTSSV